MMNTIGSVSRGFLLALAAMLPWCGRANCPAGRAGRQGRLFFIPHTHWEGAVFKTREEYLDMGLPNIFRALKLLKAHPNYRFVLDQACYVKPFLERYPEEEAAFRRFVNEGRLAIVGGTDVMPDVNMPGGESFVRQILYGKGYFRRKLGVDVTRRLAARHVRASRPDAAVAASWRGYKSFWFFRGVAAGNTPCGIPLGRDRRLADPGVLAAQGYGACYGSPNTLPGVYRVHQGAIRRPDAPARRDTAASAWPEPTSASPRNTCRRWSSSSIVSPTLPSSCGSAVPTDFEALVAQRPPIGPSFGGELNPIFQGTYSSRIELKQRTRELERLLTTAEKLGVLAGWLGMPADDGRRSGGPGSRCSSTRRTTCMSGVMTDRVYDDTIRGYDFSKRIADDEVEGRLRSLAARIDTRGEGIPIVVLNTLGWPRTRHRRGQRGLLAERCPGRGPAGPDGQAVPVQMLDGVRYCRRRPVAGRDRFRGPRCSRPGIRRLSPAAADRRGSCRDLHSGAGPGERITIASSSTRRRRDHPLAGQSRQWNVLRRSGQRRGREAGPRRSVGALPHAGRRQPHRHEDPARRAAAGQGRLQQRQARTPAR